MSQTWSPSADLLQRREVSKRLDARKEKVGAASHGRESWQAGYFLADWTLGNLVFERAVLVANERVSFVAELVKVLVVRHCCPVKADLAACNLL